LQGFLDNHLRVICGQGKLQIKSIKSAGSGQMDFAAFINGRQGCPGDLFLSIDMVRRQFALGFSLRGLGTNGKPVDSWYP